MCVPHAGPQGIISQHPACHRLQQGGRAEEVTGGWRVEGGGRSLVGLINQEQKVCPSAAEQTSMLTQREVGSGWHFDFQGCLLSIRILKNKNNCTFF